MLTTQELKPPSHIQAIIHSIFFALGLALAPFSSQLFCYMEWLHLIVCCVHLKPEPISKRSAPHQNIMWNHNNNCNHLLMFLEIDLIWFDLIGFMLCARVKKALGVIYMTSNYAKRRWYNKWRWRWWWCWCWWCLAQYLIFFLIFRYLHNLNLNLNDFIIMIILSYIINLSHFIDYYYYDYYIKFCCSRGRHTIFRYSFILTFNMCALCVWRAYFFMLCVAALHTISHQSVIHNRFTWLR